MASDFYTNPTGTPEIPDEWSIAAIEDICFRVTSGATPLRSEPSFYEGGTIPWIKTQELRDGMIWDSVEKITPKAIQNTSVKIYPVDTVLMAMYGDGKTITSLGMLGIEAATNQACCALITDPNKCLPKFLFYTLKFYRNDFIHIATGGAQRNLSGNLIRRFAIGVPPVDEQRYIANILGILDSRIELNRKMNETLEAMARALFKSWFVDFDPVRAKAEGRDTGLPADIAALFADSFENSELGEIPTGWQVKPFGDICESIFSGGTPSTTVKEYWGGDLPWLSSGETRAKCVISTEKSITRQGVEKSSTRFARAGATVIASAGQGNTRGQTSMLMLDTYINQSVVVLLSDRTKSTDAHLFLDLERRYEEFRRVSDGHSSRGSLTTKLLAGLRTVLPPLPIIKAFDSITAPIIQRIASSLRESQALAGLRDTLLPKLISGELRIQQLEALAEAHS